AVFFDHLSLVLPFPTRRSSDLYIIVLSCMHQPKGDVETFRCFLINGFNNWSNFHEIWSCTSNYGYFHSVSFIKDVNCFNLPLLRSEEHTSELQSRENLVCRLLL